MSFRGDELVLKKDAVDVVDLSFLCTNGHTFTLATHNEPPACPDVHYFGFTLAG